MGRRTRNGQKRYSVYGKVVIKKDHYTLQKSQTIGQSLTKDTQLSVRCFLNMFHSEWMSFLKVQDSASNMNDAFEVFQIASFFYNIVWTTHGSIKLVDVLKL